MQLDERTLFFTMGLLTGLLALVAWGVRTGFGERARGLGAWSLGMAAKAIPSLMIAMLPATTGPIAQNAFWVSSMVLAGFAITTFFQHAGPTWRWLLAGVVVYVGAALLSLRPQDAGSRIVLLSATHVVCSALALRALWLGASSRTALGAVLMAAGLGVLLASSVYRGLLALLGGGAAVAFSAGALAVPLFQSMLILSLLAVTLGLILLAADRLRRSIEQLATHDMLTGLLNRRGFADRSGALLAGARRRGESVALALLDLDDFKRVNDEHGHDVGDRLLADVGEVLGRNAREQDVVARLGGEEFAVLMPDTGLDGAVRLAERLRVALAERLRVDGGTQAVTASVGLAVRISPTSVQSLYSAADRSLYAAKAAGKNRVADPAG